jgi:penicillin amidase
MSDDTPPGDGAEQRSHKWWKILLGVIGALAVVVVLGGALFMRFSVHRAFPDVDGEVTITGLEAPVRVIRDDMGVAHIYADNTHDLFMAQGYVHAQERFWQMDFWRHIGSGRLAEMFGESQVETDVFLRTMGWHDVGAAQYAEAPPEDRAILEAYADGVNAYLESRSPAELSFEYSILELLNHNYDPEPWTPVDTLTWGIVMAWDLRGNMDYEIMRSTLLGTLSGEQVAQISPPYPGDINPYIVPENELVTDGTPAASIHAIPGVRTALETVGDKLDLVAAMGTSREDSGIGSNSWVISGSRSDTGMPILANDPHLAIQMP